MRKLLISLTAAVAIGGSLFAGDYLSPVNTKTDLTKLTASSAELKGLKFSTIYLYPQTAVKGNDAEANKKNAEAKAIKAEVAILANERDFSVIVRWSDTTNSQQTQNSVKAFGDAVAIQVPQNCSDTAKLPYIGMGSEGRPVTIMLQKNTQGYFPPTTADLSNTQAKNNLNSFGDDLKKKEADIEKLKIAKYQKIFVAEGFRSTTEVKEQLGYTMDMKYAGGKWTAVFTKKLKDDYSSIGNTAKTQDDGVSGSTSKTSHVVDCDVEPFAVAIWDGGKDGRDGTKWLSSWTPIKLKDSEKAKKSITEMSEKVKGDVANGKKLADENCVACHTIGNTKAPNNMAPNLDNVGGYSTAAYLRESIIAPQAVVVPGLNVNRAPVGFYGVDSAGVRTSNMPSFDYLKPNEINDLIAYLQTLKSGGPK
jgi:complex iron-sulfur molybdoenzyme family reductase subunit gamma